MKHIIITLYLSLSTLPLFCQVEKPNIILFFADDFGYGSTNVYGASTSLIQTPNINKLSEGGIHFTNAFTTGSVCSPTRYGLLTGEYSWRTRLKKGVVNTKDACLIDKKTKTLPSYLQDLGYKTAAIGKWHLGYKNERFKNLLGTIENGPNDHGFDYNFTVPNNLDDIHKIYIENNEIYGLRSDKIAAYGGSFYGNQYVGYDAPQRVTEQVMNDLTANSIKWLESFDKNEPFFLYFSSVAVHHPITPSPEMRGKSNAGAYGDFIQDIDRCLGLLIEYLEENGLRENTMIIFASDNGGDIPNKKKVMPENFAINKGLKINGDYRGDKHTIWDGGFRIPMIINHPNQIKNGLQSDAIVSTVDIYSFIGEYLHKGKEIEKSLAIDSHSFYDVIQQPNKKYTRVPLIHRDVKGRKAVRFGDWKYIEAANPNSKNETLHAQLFNLKEDKKEEHNIIQKNTKKAEELKAYLATAKNEGTRLFNYK